MRYRPFGIYHLRPDQEQHRQVFLTALVEADWISSLPMLGWLDSNRLSFGLHAFYPFLKGHTCTVTFQRHRCLSNNPKSLFAVRNACMRATGNCGLERKYFHYVCQTRNGLCWTKAQVCALNKSTPERKYSHHVWARSYWSDPETCFASRVKILRLWFCSVCKLQVRSIQHNASRSWFNTTWPRI